MNEWKQKFSQTALERGKETFLKKRVQDLKETENGYTGAVLGRDRFEVTVKMKDGNPVRMTCRCPVSRAGAKCEHMAAVLYAVEARLQAQELKRNEEELLEELRRKEMLLRAEEERRLKEEQEKKEERRRRRLGKGQVKPETLEATVAEEKLQASERQETAGKFAVKKSAAGKSAAGKSAAPEEKKVAVRRGRKSAAQKLLEEKEKAEAARLAEEKAKAEAARLAEEKEKAEAARLAEEKAKAEAARLAEEKEKARAARLEAEAEARRAAREKRKAERAKREEEKKKKEEEQRRQAELKRQAEEKRRAEARKAEEEKAARLAEKRRLEAEARRLADEKRKVEEARQAKERAAEEARQAKERAAEEARQAKERAAGKMRRAGERASGQAHWSIQGEGQMKKQSEAYQSRLNQEDSLINKEEFVSIGGAWEDSDEDTTTASRSIAELEQYRYFDINAIIKSAELTSDTIRLGKSLYEKNQVVLNEVGEGFDRYSGNPCGIVQATGEERGREFSMQLVFGRKEVLQSECSCSRCRREYSAWYSHKSSCPHIAALLTALKDYLTKYPLGDATDFSGQRLLGAFSQKRVKQAVASGSSEEQSVSLVPRLTRKEGKLQLAFRVGEGKLFVVKKLDEFCTLVREGETGTYGTSTQISHRLENFTEEGRKWITFIQQIVQEEQRLEERLQSSRNYYGYGKKSVGGSLELFGWRLDEFYRRLEENPIDFEDKENGKKKGTISSGTGRPRATMIISPSREKGSREFQGITVTGTLPELYHGTDTAYFISEDRLVKVEKEVEEKIEPLTEIAVKNIYAFQVGRKGLAEFYHRILPELEDILEVTEVDSEKIHRYVTPEVHFIFYFDVENGNVVCRIQALYGDKEVSVLSAMDETQPLEGFRDQMREAEILYQTMKWLPYFDQEKQVLHCDREEELTYQLMEHGVEELMSAGEVRCTSRFRNYQSVRRLKVSVGVSVSSGLLDLAITTEDVPREELLDLLESYQAKKKYYRLKNGAFVNMEDQSLEMLSELMNSMHLKPKDMVKGKMHLPIYRTLYLDRLLEENSSVYSSRDSHFREVVKGFKTVNDADFEEPASLSRIMRTYQKNGYKWLRTLETWKFGGILADDMGLGKTLQMIAVLLSAKEEGRTGTSLVVSPASLVFNWGAEFEQFAPALSVCLVTGTQEERQDKIERYGEYDVLVTSYDLLKRDIVQYEDKNFQYEVIDEAQYIKNHTTAAAKAVKVIHSQSRFALTGTPIENRLSELWSIFDYLMPGFLYGYDVFKRELETPIVKNQDEKAMQRLQKMVSPFILRRLKEDVLKDLPEKLEEIRYVRFGDSQQKLYDGQVLHMKERIARQAPEEFGKNRIQILAELTKLRQICCDPSLCFENYKGEAAKVEACLQLIQSAVDGGHRMLLFSQFTSMLEILQGELERAGISYFIITGATAKEKRLQMVKEFNEGKTPVFLISLKAGGVGLNLTGADMVIHYDPWWNQAAQNQATDRAHRIGQTKKVTVYKLIAKHTIEEKIQKLQETKRDLADQVINSGTGQLGSMTQEDLLELLEGK